MTTLERYYTTAELADMTGKSPDYWQRLCKAGGIAGVKLGNDWRVAASIFEAFMRGGQTKVARPGRLSSRGRRTG